jgi:hypothetical protein
LAGKIIGRATLAAYERILDARHSPLVPTSSNR